MNALLAHVAVAVGWFISGHVVAQPTREMRLPSCVAGSPALSVAADAAHATLDISDRRRFHSAAQTRYPLYQRGGFVPSEVLLVQRNGQWLYVAISPIGAKGSCFTALFAAERFDFTERWLAKYRPLSGGMDD